MADYERAVSAFRHALDLHPLMRNAELYLGLSEAKAGDLEGASPSLARGFWNVNNDPCRLQAGMLLAELFSARQEEDKLHGVVRALRQGFPSNADVLYMAYRLYSVP